MINTNYSFPKIKYNNKKSNNISFEGNTPQKLLLRFESPKTEKEAIKNLISKDSGCYYKTEKGYNLIPREDVYKKENFNFGHVVLKQPLRTRTIYGMADFGSFQYRNGISPIWIIRGLKQKMGRLMLITGSKDHLPILQILHFPKNEEANKIAIQKTNDWNPRILAHKKYIPYLKPEIRNKFAFYETKNAIKSLEIEGLRLEEFHLHK